MNPVLAERVAERFLTHLVATPRGRAFLLGQVADAEGSDEGAIFDHLLAKVEDPELRRMIRRHADDEVRHEALFRARSEAQGVVPPRAPEHLKILPRLSARLGDVMRHEVATDLDVMNAYLLLQVLEERAVTRFPLFERCFRAVDPESADVFAQVAKDEERHLKYCHAISRRFAPDPLARMATLRRFREVEAVVFAETSGDNMELLFARGIVRMPIGRELAWRGFSAVSRRLGGKARTRFWDEMKPGVIDVRTLAAA